MILNATPGLHIEDAKNLLGVLHRLVDQGKAMIVISAQPGRDQNGGLGH